MVDILRNHVLYTEYDSIRQICSPLKLLGITGFIYMQHYKNGEYVNLSNHIEWADFFLSRYMQGLYTFEELRNHMLIKNKFNLWITEQDNSIWQEGKNYFNSSNGITICNEFSDF